MPVRMRKDLSYLSVPYRPSLVQYSCRRLFLMGQRLSRHCHYLSFFGACMQETGHCIWHYFAPSPSVHLQSHAADYLGRLQLYQITMRHPMVCFAPWSGRCETIGANYPVVHSAAPRQQLNNCSCLSPCRLPNFPHFDFRVLGNKLQYSIVSKGRLRQDFWTAATCVSETGISASF